MKKSTNLLLTLALGSMLFSAPALAQDNPGEGGWTLPEAIEYAKKNNLQVKQTRINRDVTAIDLKQAKLDRLPSLNGSAQSAFSSGTTVDPTVQELRVNEYTSLGIGADASVPLFMGLQQTNLIKQRDLDLQASEFDIQSIQDDISLQIITSYLNVLFAEELIKTAELQRGTTQQQLDRTRILFKAGSVAEVAVLDLESQLATDDLDIITARNQRDISRLSLIQLLNLESDQARDFEIVIPEVPEPDQLPVLVEPALVYDAALQNQPGVRAADLRVMSADKGLAIARGAYYPRLSLNANVNSFYNSENPLFENTGEYRPIQLGYSNQEGTEAIIYYVPKLNEIDYPLGEQLKNTIGKQIGLNLTVPIFNGLLARNNVQRAKLGQLNAKLNADLERNQLRQTIEQAYVDALAAQRKYTAAKQQLTALEKSYKNAELRLNSGVINTVDFYVITTNYRTAQSNLIQAKYEYTFKLKVLDFYQGKEITL
ncbi:TolC family protein [Pontibacter sp. KCTC 32443]|uniref:TolC family protein n=1 Tax=Pontibacter TaxID=323449 RepID=UPI00164D9ABA|nr:MULTISPECIES: TolC family protein [Pontibacter]MBC5773405.1 TolC family protein [Pontibacter sp. KCTC 32443]